MNADFITNESEKDVLQPESPNSNWAKTGKRTHDIAGSLANLIGTGPQARHSIALIVIIGCFLTGCLITLLVISNYWLFRDGENKVPDIVSDLKVIWEIVIPIITLILGYEFGRHEK